MTALQVLQVLRSALARSLARAPAARRARPPAAAPLAAAASAAGAGAARHEHAVGPLRLAALLHLGWDDARRG